MPDDTPTQEDVTAAQTSLKAEQISELEALDLSGLADSDR